MLMSEVVSFLRSIQGEGRGGVERTILFLLHLQKDNGATPPPFAEIITILKHEKPILYGILKQRFQSNEGMKIVFELELDYEHVKRKLHYK